MTAETLSDTITVLVVDDVEDSRQTLRRALGFDDRIEVIGEAGSGREAIEKAESLRPDLILMDVRMPDGNGIEATGAILRKMPSARIVALTAFEDVDTVRDMLAAGATGYFVKGAPVDDLLDAVHAANRGEGRVDERVLPTAIDELRRLVQDERTARAEAERVARLRQEFLQVLSHELRTPLTVITGALRFMERRSLTPEEETLVASALRRGGDLERMVEGLELVAESPSDGAPVANPAQAVPAAIERVGEAIIACDMENGRWAGVRARHLTRVAQELISNAVSHGVHPVEVCARRDGLDGILEVSDAGGSDLDDALFEAFAQGDMSATRESGGLGLGLFIARRLCESDGGTLTLERRQGRTVATARYPLR